MRSYITREKRRKCFMWFPIAFTTTAVVQAGDTFDCELEINKGLFKKEIKRINLCRVTDVSYSRDFFDLLFFRGNIEIRSTDPKYKALRITKIHKTREFADFIETFVKTERNRAGVKYTELNVLS